MQMSLTKLISKKLNVDAFFRSKLASLFCNAVWKCGLLGYCSSLYLVFLSNNAFCLITYQYHSFLEQFREPLCVHCVLDIGAAVNRASWSLHFSVNRYWKCTTFCQMLTTSMRKNKAGECQQPGGMLGLSF